MAEAQVGWHPDPRDPAVMWFWSGTEWTASRAWDGTNWVDRQATAVALPAEEPLAQGSPPVLAATMPTPAAAPVTPAPAPAPAAIPAATPVAPAAATRLGTMGWLLCGGVAAVVVAALLPWAQASELGITVSTKPSGGGPVLLIVLAGVVLLIGWPGLRQKLVRRRALGLLLMVAVLSIFVISNWNSLGDLQHTHRDENITAGSGLWLYTVGVVVLWVAAVRLWRSRQRSTPNP